MFTQFLKNIYYIYDTIGSVSGPFVTYAQLNNIHELHEMYIWKNICYFWVLILISIFNQTAALKYVFQRLFFSKQHKNEKLKKYFFLNTETSVNMMGWIGGTLLKKKMPLHIFSGNTLSSYNDFLKGGFPVPWYTKKFYNFKGKLSSVVNFISRIALLPML